ncbi:MAG: right-handed parallel beta-helix repeat-containing protein [Clostridia bacterium]|nr:right-handed parallel beta-helix repeat-containing protein [Clostridia bacterium]
MRKKILGLVTLLLVLVCVAGTALAAHTSHTVCGVFCIAGTDCNGTTHEAGNEHTTVARWNALPSEGVTVSVNGRQTLYLNGDTTLTGPIVVSGGGALNLCLNGYTLTMGVDGDVITAGQNSSVTICDCSSGKTGKIVHAPGKVGRAVYMKGSDSGYASLHVYGGTFSKHTAPEGEYGAAFYLENTFARMFDCEISYNAGWEDCGTVYVTGYHYLSDLYLYKDAKICNNTSGLPGGVLVQSTRVSGLDDSDKIPRLYMQGGEISYNKGRDGGGVKLLDYAQLWLSSGSINNNSAATNGGGVFVGNQKTTKYPQLYMCGSGSITNNTAPLGGGVFNRGYFLANATGEISGNSATHNGDGGGLHTAYGDTDVWSLRITGNSAERKGGGVYIGDGYNGGSFAFATENDSADERYIRGNTVKGVENNVHLEDNSKIWLYTASYDGGCNVGVTVDMPDDSNTYRFLSTDRGYGSTALAQHLTGFVSDQGYAISMDSGNFGIVSGDVYTVTVTGGTGSGSYAPGATVTVTATPGSGQTFVGWVTDDITLSDPTASTVAFAMPDKDVTIRGDYAVAHSHVPCGKSGCSDSNHPSHTAQTYQGWNGVSNINVTSGTAAYYLVADVETKKTIKVSSGATLYLCLNGKTLSKSTTIDVQGTLHLCDCAGGGVITRPTNQYPRAADIASSGTMYMYGGKLTGHEITAKHGGALYNQGRLHIFGGEISGNTVTRNTTLEQGGYGGGIYSSDELYIYGGKISGNTANSGGGVCVYGDTATDVFKMTGGEISGNTASSSNAGMWINGQAAMTATLTGGTIKNNTAGVSGGGLCVNGSAKLTMSGMTFTGNVTTGSGGGGGLYLSSLSNTATVENCTFSGNSAGMYGGGIHVTSAKADLKNLTITGNEADNGGGGIAVIGHDNQVLIHNCRITGNDNEQIYGGGLYVGASGVTLSGNTTITGNTANGQTVNMQIGSGLSETGLPKVTTDFTGSVGVRTFFAPTASESQLFIANAAGGAVTAAQLAKFTSDEGFARRVNADGYGELFVGHGLTVVNGTGSGEYAPGEVVSIGANEAPEGHAFDKWVITSGTATIANAASPFTTITMGTADVTVEATYKSNNYAIHVNISPAEGGTVTGAGFYAHGDTVTLTATPATGYEFHFWQKGNWQSKDESITFTATESAEYSAYFRKQAYFVRVSVEYQNGGGPGADNGGEVTGVNRTYYYGETVTLTATLNPGWTFLGYYLNNKELLTDELTYSFTVEGEVWIHAKYVRNDYTITAVANPAEGGTVTGGKDYGYGDSVTLTATANENWTFTNWTDEDGTVVSTDAAYTFTATDAATLTANFTRNTCTIMTEVNPAGGGDVTGSGTYECGAQVTLTATAFEGWVFESWQLNGEVVSTDATYTFTADGDATLTAVFARSKHTITVTASPTEGGTATGGGTYEYGEEVTLTATAAEGYAFTGWQLNGATMSTNATFTFYAVEDAAYTAIFSKNAYTITATASPAEGGSVTGAGNYAHGDSVTLTATANEHWTFTNWTDADGETVSTEATYQFTAMEPVTLTAHFAKNTYAITATADPAEGGTVTGAGNYEHGATVTLTATANEGWNFLGWHLNVMRNSEYDTTETTFTFTAEANATAVAYFGRKQPPVVITHPADQSVHAGDTVVFTAAATGEGVRCQWQIDTGDGVWRDIRDAVSTSLTFTAEDADNGHRYRCVFTNADGEAVTNAAKLTVLKDVPQTGDGAQPGLMAALMLLTMAAAWLLKRKTA